MASTTTDAALIIKRQGLEINELKRKLRERDHELAEANKEVRIVNKEYDRLSYKVDRFSQAELISRLEEVDATHALRAIKSEDAHKEEIERLKKIHKFEIEELHNKYKKEIAELFDVESSKTTTTTVTVVEERFFTAKNGERRERFIMPVMSMNKH